MVQEKSEENHEREEESQIIESETKIDDSVSKTVEEKETDDGVDEISKNGATEKKTTEEHSKGHDKQEKTKEKTLEAEANIADDTLKQTQEICEGKHKIEELYQGDNAEGRKVQKIIRRQESDEQARCEKEAKQKILEGQEKIQELVDEEEEEEEIDAEMGKRITPNIAETETKDELESDNAKVGRQSEDISLIKNLQESQREEFRRQKKKKELEEDPTNNKQDAETYTPKVPEEPEKIQQLAKELTNVSRKLKAEEEFGDDDISRKVGDSVATKGKEEKEDIQEEKAISSLAEKIIENDKSRKKVQEIDKQQSRVISDRREVEYKKKTIDAEKSSFRDSAREAQEFEELQENEQEDKLFNLKRHLEQDVGEKTQELSEEKSTDDDIVRKVQGIKEEELYRPKREGQSKIKETVQENSENDHEYEEEESQKLNELTSQEKQEEEKEKIVESTTSVEASDPKQYKFQEMVEEEEEEEEPKETVIPKKNLETEEGRTKKSQDIEEDIYDHLKRSMVQETEERDKTKAMGKSKDGSLKKVQDEEEGPESSKPYNRQEEDMEMGMSDDGEKLKKQNRDDILRNQEAEIPNSGEFKRHGGQRNIPQFSQKEKMGNIVHDDSSDKFYQLYEEEIDTADPEYKHREKFTAKSDAKNVQDIEKHKYDEMQPSVVQDKMQETNENEKSGVMEEEEIVERMAKTRDGSSSRKEDPKLGRLDKPVEEELAETETSDERENIKKKDELERDFKQRKIQLSVEEEKGEGKLGGKMGIDSSGKFHEFQKQKSYEEMEDLVIGEEKRYEKVAHTNKTKVEDEINRNVGKNKEQEFGKEKLERVLRDGESNREKEDENRLEDFLTKVQEIEKEESYATEIQEKLDETWDQENEKAEEPTGKDSPRKEQKKEELDEQSNIVETSDGKVKEEEDDEEETKEPEVLAQDFREGRGGERSKQRKTVETKSDDRIVRKMQETKVKESNGNKKQESKGINLEVTEDDSLRKGQEVSGKESSKRERVEPEQIQEVEKQRVQKISEMGTQTNIGKSRTFEVLELEESMEPKSILKPKEEAMRDIKDQEIPRHGLLKNGERDKFQGRILEETKYHREDKKGMEDREIEETERTSEDVSSKKPPKTKPQESNGFEKHGKLREIQENQTVEEKGGYKTKSLASSQSQDVEEKKSDAEQELKEEEVFAKPETLDGSRKIHEHEEGMSDKLKRHGENETSEKLAGQETVNNKALAIAVKHIEQDKKQPFVENDMIENKNLNKRSRDDSSRKTQESHEQKRNEELYKNLGLVEAKFPRKLKGIELLVDDKMKNQEREEEKSMTMEVLAKVEEHKSKEHQGLRNEDKIREEGFKDNLTYKEIRSKENDESIETHQNKEKETSEQERLQEKFVEDKISSYRESEFEEVNREEATETGKDEKSDKIQEPVDNNAIEDDEEEEVEVEVEDSEEEWEAQVIQEMDSDEEDKIRQIRRIKLGFRIIGGSTLFMSLIVIFIRFIRSKRKIKCYNF